MPDPKNANENWSRHPHQSLKEKTKFKLNFMRIHWTNLLKKFAGYAWHENFMSQDLIQSGTRILIRKILLNNA